MKEEKWKIKGLEIVKTEETSSKIEIKDTSVRRSFETTKTVHNQEPDYKRPLISIPAEARERIFSRMSFIYGEAAARANMPELERILEVYYAHKPEEMIRKEQDLDPEERFTERMLFS